MAAARASSRRPSFAAGRVVLPFALLAATLVLVASKQVESPEMGIPHLYTGMIAWAFIWAFIDAFTIGANDVANAFANAVGAGTVSHRTACLIACFFELLGVIALGKQVTDTIRKKMTDVKRFTEDPYVLALGMSFVNVGSGLWVLLATICSMPVSTTHSVVGATLGIGIAAWGPTGVVWAYEKKGFLSVLASWFISPVASGTLAAIFYMATKIMVLSLPTDDAQLKAGLMYMPAYFFFVFGTIWGFMMMKGMPPVKKTPYSITVPITVGLAVFHTVWGLVFTIPWLRRTIIDKENLPWYTSFYTPCVGVGSMGYYEPEWEQGKGGKSIEDGNVVAVSAEETVAGGNMGQEGDSTADAFGKMIAPGFYMDIGAKREEDAAMHACAFQCATRTEEMFKFLQLTSCCFFSLSHGANDVANAVGPFSAVWAVYSSGLVEKKSVVPIWVLVYGGLALDIGLLTMGHTIMAALGNRVTLQTPSRGFCIELGAMFTVMVASRIGVPVSTTHCITGATVGVGLCNGNFAALNWTLLIIIFGGWVITCPMAGLMAGLAFWGVAGSPHPVPQNLYFGSEGSPWLNRTWAAVAYDLPFPPADHDGHDH